MWIRKINFLGLGNISKLFVLLALGWSMGEGDAATAQSLSPNLLPAGAPLPGESSPPANRYAAPSTYGQSPTQASDPGSPGYTSNQEQYYQPGRTNAPPASSSSDFPQPSAAPSRYPTSNPSTAQQQPYPTEQQRAAQRYAALQQPSVQPQAPQLQIAQPQPLASPEIETRSTLPPYQVREIEHQHAYEQFMAGQSSNSNAVNPQPGAIPPATRPDHNPVISNQSSYLNSDTSGNQVPTGGTVRASSALPSSGARYTQSRSSATSLPERNPYREPSHQAEQAARPVESWGTRNLSPSTTADRYQTADNEQRQRTNPNQSVVGRRVGELAESQLNPASANATNGTTDREVLQTAAEVSSEGNASGQVGVATEGGSALTELQAQIQQQTKELEANANVDEQLKTDGLAALRSAIEWLGRTTQWERKTAEFKAEAESVPEEITKAKRLLEKPAPVAKPIYAADAGLVNLEQLMAEAEAALKEIKTAFEEQDKQLKLRSERKAAIGKQLEQLDARVIEIQKGLKAGSAEGLPPVLAQAQILELKARDLASRAERQLLQAESLRHEAVTELLPLQRDLSQRAVKQQEVLVNAWREEVAAFRKRESERQAQEARERLEAAHPALKALAEQNATLAERRQELAHKIEVIHGDLERINATVKDIDLNYKGIMEKVKVVGLSSTVGMLLRKQRGELPNLAYHHERLRSIELELPQVQLASLELEEQRESIADLDVAVENVVGELKGVESQFEPEELQRIVREFLETKKKYLDDLLNDNDAYQDALGELDIVTRKLTGKTAEFCNYIDKHVLWIRSADPIGTADVSQSASALAILVSPRTFVELLTGIGRTLKSHPVQWLVTLLGFIALRLTANRFRSRLSVRLQDVRKVGFVACFAPVWASLGLTLFNAMMWPALTWLVGWQLASMPNNSELVAALALGLMTTSMLGIALEIIRQACVPGGLAENYLDWPAEQLQLLRKKLRWLMILGLPAVFLVVVIEKYQEGEWADSAGRLIFIAGMGLLAILSHGLLRPGASLWHQSETTSGHLVQRLRHLWYTVSIAAPLGLAWLAATGYYYSARELAERLKMSFWLLVATVIVTSLLTRMLMMVAQGISRHKRHGIDALAASQDDKGVEISHEPSPETLPMSEMQPNATDVAIVESVASDARNERVVHDLDMHNVRAQVTRLVQGAALLCFIMVSWNIWEEVLPAFRVLDKVELWTTVRDVMENVTDPDGNITVTMVKKPVPTTLSHLILALAIFQITLLAAKNLPGLLEIAVLDRLPIDRGGRYAVSVICRYALTVTGFVFGFRMLGLTWNSVQWLVAAMTVGLGFGLQEIFANFVSGMIILFERPVRVGDLVTIGGMTGTVARVQIRATTITDADRRELIIPNKNIITGELVNWTLSDTISRVVIPIGVAYGSDVELTQKTLLQIADAHREVLKDPAPSAMFVSFGDSTLNFELRFFLGSRDCYAQVLHELNSAIDQKFRAAKIEIAFPQQELTIKSIAPILPFLKDQLPDADVPAVTNKQRAA